MLSTSSIKIATNLAAAITSANKTLIPKQNTLLGELTNSVKNGVFSKVNDPSIIEMVISQASTGKEVTNKNIKNYIQSDHDTMLDNYVIDLSGIISNQIQFVRNVANKEVKKFKDELETSVNGFKYKEPEDFFEITYFKLHDIFTSVLIENEILTFSTNKTNFILEGLSNNKLTSNELDVEKYLLTGEESLDALILNWISIQSKEKVLGYIVNDCKEYALDIPELFNYSLANYLFYRNLTEKVDINFGLTILQLRAKASNNRNYFGVKLNMTLDLYNKLINNGKLLSSSSETNFSYYSENSLKITVYEKSFEKLVEATCPIEALFGYIAFENDNDITADKLIANKETYVDKWHNIRNLYLVKINNSKLDTFKQILKMVFDKTLKEAPADEIEGKNTITNFDNETLTQFDYYINNLNLSGITDLDNIALEIVAGIRFRFSNAFFVLKEMSEILKMSDNVTVEEAALYAYIKYTTSFMLEQCSIS